MGRHKLPPQLKKIQLQLCIDKATLNKFKTPTHARLYAQAALTSYQRNPQNESKTIILSNYNANKALQNFLKKL
jgi:hypothetical protein